MIKNDHLYEYDTPSPHRDVCSLPVSSDCEDFFIWILLCSPSPLYLSSLGNAFPIPQTHSH